MNNTAIKSIMISVVVGAIICMGILVGASFAFVKMAKLPFEAIGIIALFSCVVGALSSGYVCGRILKENGMFFGIICGAVLFLAVFLSGIFMLHEAITFFALVKCLLMILMSAIGSIIAVNKKERVRRY